MDAPRLDGGRMSQSSLGPSATASAAAPQYKAAAVSTHEASESATTPASGFRTFVGRGAYLAAPGGHMDEDEPPPNDVPSVFEQTSAEIFRLQKALDVPPRVVRDVLLESYWRHCHPWMPVVNNQAKFRATLDCPSSPLLLQAMLMAGSRMASIPITYASSAELYARAKTLFWLDSEKDPVVCLIAACTLQWWTPHGPESFSLDTAYSWLRLAVSIAFQIGLHQDGKAPVNASLQRRIWWSLVARDCCISVAHGRPRAIKLYDSDVPMPCESDFRASGLAMPARFVSYVKICLILGDIAERHHPPKAFPSDNRLELETKLRAWIQALPPELKIYEEPLPRRLMPYNFETRQLHVAYLAALVIANHPSNINDPPSRVAILASSLIAGLFDEFLIRDDVRFLGPVFTFYLLAASLTQLRCCQYTSLRATAEFNLRIIERAQVELEKKWPSATGSQRLYSKVRDRIFGQATSAAAILSLPDRPITPAQRLLFQDYGDELCNQWHLFPQDRVTEGENLAIGIHDSVGEFARASETDDLSTILDDSLGLIANPGHHLYGMNSDLGQDREITGGDIGSWLLWDDVLV
ncbi:uncharacterized protein PV07_05981 [Cladophialophora immunda]|uniref:Xylanolytic transcriptional activator regulatory domain-containing protein n=1 Tax=Cladophialophora immunda TaxID=569365 RepID=A0A0D2AY43_9EURO|nr:uncharacterized protein PV07_05981 [Cladophialophora immunda]KIW30222.1 hypothetical protein PV07_05981 [Cladophialophora immunda]